jgi:hypothetical protein
VIIKWARKTTETFPNLIIDKDDEPDCFHTALPPNQQKKRESEGFYITLRINKSGHGYLMACPCSPRRITKIGGLYSDFFFNPERVIPPFT